VNESIRAVLDLIVEALDSLVVPVGIFIFKKPEVTESINRCE